VITLANVNVRTFAGTTARLAQLVATQSAILSYADATYFVALVGMAGIPLVFLLRRPARRQSR
jgi:hypothetical protein